MKHEKKMEVKQKAQSKSDAHRPALLWEESVQAKSSHPFRHVDHLELFLLDTQAFDESLADSRTHHASNARKKPRSEHEKKTNKQASEA